MSGTFTSSKHPRGAAGSGQGGKFITSQTVAQQSSGKSGKGKSKNSKLTKAALAAQKILGSLDAQVIRRFQQQNGLQVDGVIGAQTANALLGEDDPMAPGALQPDQVTALAAMFGGGKKPKSTRSRSTKTKKHP